MTDLLQPCETAGGMQSLHTLGGLDHLPGPEKTILSPQALANEAGCC